MAILLAVTRWLAVIVLLAMASTTVTAQSPTYEDVMNAFSRGDSVGGTRLLRQSAEAGDLDSQWFLGTFFATGSDSFPQDPIEALKWFEIVASCAAQDRTMAIEGRDQYLAEMTDSQIEEARQRARAWRALHSCGP